MDLSPAHVPALTTSLESVFVPSFLRKLDRLRLSVTRSLSTRPGNTPMPGRTQDSGIEVDSHKPYASGDDLRHVDWNAYGRLDEMLVRRFRAEREAPLHLFLDLSASMSFPESDGKAGFTSALAACLTYISLRNHDPVRIVGLTQAAPSSHLLSPWFRHRQSLASVREFLQAMRSHGGTALTSGVIESLRQQHLTGVAVIISDFLSEAPGYERAFSELLARKLTVAAIRVLGPVERDPSREIRQAELVDAESGNARVVTLSADNLDRYRSALEHHLSTLRETCSRSGVLFSVVDPTQGIEPCLFGDLPRAGLIR